jgi:hypothetical protein
MVRKGRDVTAYSTTQIRKFLSLAQMSDAEFPRAIDEAIRTYTPQPSKTGSRGDPIPDPRYLERQKKKNVVIGEKIKAALTRMDAPTRTRFMQYLLWDTKIVEQGFRMYKDPMPFFKKLFDVEGLKNSNELIKILESLAGYDTREGRGFGPESRTGFETRRSRS